MLLNPATILSTPPVQFSSPRMLLLCFFLFALLLILAIVRRPSLPLLSRVLAGVGILCLVLASGNPSWRIRDTAPILVMVDLSPSTRGAEYRNPAALRRRIDQLVGAAPHQIRYFAQDIQNTIDESDPLPDLPASRTIFAPSPAAGILLFSDARFDLPDSAPPTYIVLDPYLESAADVSVTNLEQRHDSIVATVKNGANAPVPLTLIPAADRTYFAPSGNTAIPIPLRHNALLTTKATSNDLWPENDALSIRTLPPDRAEQWWVSTSPAPPGWRAINPSDLPTDPSAYLAAAIIALDNIHASDLPGPQQQLLHRYVHDLGGGLLILGGDRAFAAGQYPGMPLEALSPVASTPPNPTVHWIILADASGSMAGPAPGGAKWDHARRALTDLLPRLPPNDAVSIGSFAETITWWSQGKTASETAALSLPPQTIRPSGPTNLQSAIAALTSLPDGLPRQVLMITDGQANLDQPVALAQSLLARRIRLHILAIGEETPQLTKLIDLSRSTDGLAVRQLDPQKWIEAARQLYSLAASSQISSDPIQINFLANASALPSRAVALWNQVFLKRDATPLAQSLDQKNTLAARWNLGAGKVLSSAFAPTAQELALFTSLSARAPRDPRLRVTLTNARRPHVAIDAIENNQFLNNLKFDLHIQSENAAAALIPIPQSAPGRYEATLDSPAFPSILTVRLEGNPIDRSALPGRYPPEFDDIGNDHRAMKQLAARTAGRVIPPAETKPIQFPHPLTLKSLTPWLAALGSLLLSTSLILWRRAT